MNFSKIKLDAFAVRLVSYKQKLNQFGVLSDINIKMSKTEQELFTNFDKKLISNSEKMEFYFKLIHCFENDLRKMINEILFAEFGKDWWDKIILSSETKKMSMIVKIRKKIHN